MSRKFYLRTQGSPVDGWWQHWIDKSNLQIIFWYLWNFWKQIRKKISNHGVVCTSPISPAETPKKIINRNRVHFWYWNSMLCTLLPKVSRVCATQSIFRFCEEELVDLSQPLQKNTEGRSNCTQFQFWFFCALQFSAEVSDRTNLIFIFFGITPQTCNPKSANISASKKKSTQRYSIQHLVPTSVPDKNY